MNSEKVQMYMRIAQQLAGASTCARIKVGAVLLKDARIIAGSIRNNNLC